MISYSIIFTIEGPKANNHHLELPVFAEKVAQFSKLLASSIKSDSYDGVVVNTMQLGHSSPATVQCQPMMDMTPHGPTVKSLEEKLVCIDSEKADQVDDGVLSAMENLAKINPGKIAWSKITTINENTDDMRIFELDDEFRDKLWHARREEYAETSTIDGVLEEINIHSRPHTCKIYDASFASATIRCEFPAELLEQVQHALGSGVFVSGDFFYRPGTSIPYKIELHDIEILPPSKELPSLRDLEGIAPGLTGDKTAEEFVRELRSQWNKD